MRMACAFEGVLAIIASGSRVETPARPHRSLLYNSTRASELSYASASHVIDRCNRFMGNGDILKKQYLMSYTIETVLAARGLLHNDMAT
jgi:hypothetical protein